MFRELEALHERVFLFPQDETAQNQQPNILILRGQHQTVLVDAGNSPRHARMVMTEMVGRNFAPIDTLIYTHHHWDHVFGAMVYNPTYVMAHEICYQHLHGWANRPWNTLQLRDEMYRNPLLEQRNTAITNAITDWRDFRIVTPTITFQHSLHYFLDDDFELELVHVGGSHADDSIIVKMPQAGIIALGDCFYATPYPQRTHDEKDTLNAELLATLLDPAYRLYVDGHHRPYTYDEMVERLNNARKRA